AFGNLPQGCGRGRKGLLCVLTPQRDDALGQMLGDCGFVLPFGPEPRKLLHPLLIPLRVVAFEQLPQLTVVESAGKLLLPRVVLCSSKSCGVLGLGRRRIGAVALRILGALSRPLEQRDEPQRTRNKVDG